MPRGKNKAQSGEQQRDQQLNETRQQVEQETEKASQRQNEVRPTPSQEEIDRARLGTQSLEELDNKEADGSPEEDEQRVRGGLSYQTRDARPTDANGDGKTD